MTPGEKMVWAAAFAVDMDRWLTAGPPTAEIVRDRERWSEWESAQVHQAVERASVVVQHMREAVPGIEEGFGAGSDVATMLREMLAP